MIEWILKPALILGVAALAALAAKRAATRHFVWTLAFVALLLLRVAPDIAVVKARPPVAVPAAVEALDSAFAPVYESRSVDPGARVRMALLLFWIAGVMTVWSRILAGLFEAGRITRVAAPAGRLGRAALFEHPDLATPFTWGIVKPAIVLPSAESPGWTEARRRNVLAHESAHVGRADWLTQTFAQLLCGVYWFHPLVWLAASKMRAESERACDDAVIREGAAVDVYAEDLLELARQSSGLTESPSAAVAMWKRSHLEERIMRILTDHDRRGLGRFAAVAMTLAALAAIAPVASVRILAQAQAGAIVLRGVVNDPSGARVPGTNIRVLGGGAPQQQAIASTVTGADGSYRVVIPAASGPMLAIAEKPGFASRAVPVAPGGRSEIIQDFSLSVGQISENLSVAGVRPPGTRMRTSVRPERIRVGGNVQAANLIRKTDPVYPQDLQDKNIEGTVELEAIVSKEGNVISAHPRSKAVHPGLAEAAMAAVSTWQYRPTLLNGEPIEVVTTVTIRFHLQ
jgi:TonB family protein